MIKFIAATLMSLTLMGCANGAKQYYEAVEKTARANADVHVAKMNALAVMAQNGDASSQGAAVMAIALSQAPVVQPQYVESAALSWARTLATPAAAVAGLYMQTDLAKTQARYNRDIQFGQQGVQMNQDNVNSSTILGLSTSFGAGSEAAFGAITGLATSGFNALNIAGDQTVGIASQSLTTIQAITTSNNSLVRDLSGGYNDTINTFVLNPLQPLVVEPVIVETGLGGF
jgi:hypothetical protein